MHGILRKSHVTLKFTR